MNIIILGYKKISIIINIFIIYELESEKSSQIATTYSSTPLCPFMVELFKLYNGGYKANIYLQISILTKCSLIQGATLHFIVFIIYNLKI